MAKFEKAIQSFKNMPKIGTALLFLILYIISIILFFGRNDTIFKMNWILNIFPDFYSHISNFSLLFLVYITFGYVGIMMGVKMKTLVIAGLLLLIFNFVVELFVNILNTPDLIDAVYGFFGVFFGFVFLIAIRKYGFNINQLRILYALLSRNHIL